MTDADIYVVEMNHTDGRTTYAGKDAWDHTESPEAVFSIRSAQGKARYWRKISSLPHHKTTLKSVTIRPASINIGAVITESFDC